LKAGGNISNNLVVDGSLDVKTALTLPIVGDVKDAIQGKQNTIDDGDLTIANTAELQTTLNGRQNTINDGDLTIANTVGLQTALDDKQDDITTDTDLTLNSITTDDLILNKNLNVDFIIAYDSKKLNTIVIRRP
jgi:hypothetical protein